MNKFREAQNWLNQLASEAKFFCDKKVPSLETTKQMLKALGNPDEFFDWRVVVGGTAGKGTVCQMTEDVLIGEAKRVATLMSPHVYEINERIRINGKNISNEAFGRNILEIKKVSEKEKINCTYYEAIVLAGILAAKLAECEVLIAEVGLGGKFDAVNALKGKRIAALTFIGEDHMDILGALPAIARTKAGIFTEETVLALSGEKEYSNIISNTSKVPITLVKGIIAKLNKKISRKICTKILRHSNFKIQKVSLPARWEKLGKFILDGAHSKPRFEFILPKIKRIKGKKIGILGMTKNHDPLSFEVILSAFDEIFYIDDFTEDRTCWTRKDLLNKLGRGRIDFSQTQTCIDFIEKNYPKENVLVLGSFYLSGKVRPFLHLKGKNRPLN